MAGQWFFSSTNWLTFPPGAVAGNGAYTLVVLATNTAINNRFMSLWSASAEQQYLMQDTSKLFGKDDFTSGFGTGITTGTWFVLSISKPAGSGHYRFHVWPYASDGSGTMQHGESAGSANQANTAATAAIHVGRAVGNTGANGIIALAAVWDRQLSDADMDSLKTKSLSAWMALTPKFLASLQNWNGTTGAVDVTGNSGAPTLTGSIDAAANPPSFDFTLGGGGTAVTATYSGTGTASALVVETERAAANYSGSGTASATVSSTGGTTQVTATFSGDGTAAAALVEIERAAALFAGSGSAAAAVSASGGTMSVVASFAGTGTASAVVGAAFARTATFSGDGTPWAFVLEVEALSAGFSGTGTASAAVDTAGGIKTVSAAFGGTGTASAVTGVLLFLTATFAGTGTARAAVRIGGGVYSVETDVADALADVVQAATGATVAVGAVAPAADGGIALTLSGVGDDARQSMRRLMCQIRTRGATQDQREPVALADAVFDVLHGARELPTAGESVIAHIYRVSWVSLGRDENRRWERSDNYYLDLTAPGSALLET